jgi:hypothetical protein
MKFFKNLRPELRLDDLLLCVMYIPALNTATSGCVEGESTIHEAMFALSESSEFSQFEELKFLNLNGLPWSFDLHNTIRRNCKDMSIKSLYNHDNDNTVSIFSDDAKFDIYDRIYKKEKILSDTFDDYTPKVFFLSDMGIRIAEEIYDKKLDKKQKKLLAQLYKA